MMLTIACVLRSGGDFTPEYVERLHQGVTQHLHMPHRFVCLSDVKVPCDRIPLRHNWPGWWSKLELFALPDTLDDVLYFDLDTIITGDLSDIASVNCLAALSDCYQPDYLASGMMYLPPDWRWQIWEKWIKDPQRQMKLWAKGGDQRFIETVIGPYAARFQDLYPDQIFGWKHVRYTGVPKNARIVFFHGRPRPPDVNWSLEPRPFSLIGDRIAEGWAPEVSIK